MKYGISSYHRPECETYKALKALNIRDEDIIICVNDKDDFKAYKYPQVVYTEGDCVACNRNHLLEITQGNIVLLDDDIKCFKQLKEKDTKSGIGFERITDKEAFEEIMEDCFQAMQKYKANTFGVYSMENAEWAYTSVIRDGIFSVNKLYQGGCCGFFGGTKMYDENFKVLDDYELILRDIRQRKRALRRNDIVASKGKMGGNQGGYYSLYKMGIQRQYGEKLVMKYHDLVRSNDDFSRFALRRRNEK